MDPQEYLAYFAKQYADKLTVYYNDVLAADADRLAGFQLIFAELLRRKNRDFTIIETGCLRYRDGWSDGQSSLLFYEFINLFGGKLITLDIDPVNLDTCRAVLRESPAQKLRPCEFLPRLGDSLKLLAEIDEPADLLYLDSCDITAEQPELSMAHHFKELASAGKILAKSPGLIVAVDDNGPAIGKGRYVLDWAKKTGQRIIHEGYQIIFQIV